MNDSIKAGEINIRFIEIIYELEILENYINYVEFQLPKLIKSEKEKAHQKKQNYDPDEWMFIEHELYNLIEDVLPRYFRNPIIVALWAIFESAIKFISKEIKDQLNIPIKLNDIRGNFLEKTDKYFNHIIKFPIDVEKESWKQFNKLYLLRNSIAHGNGCLDNIKNDKTIKSIHEWADENSDISIIGRNIICSPSYLKQTYSIVFSFLKILTEEVMKKYPTPKNW